MKFCFTQKDFIERDAAPQKLAVIDDNGELSWMDFESEVNQLCRALQRKLPAKSERPIIIYGHKSKHMVVAVYSCMKLGISYIPVDVIYPIERVKKIQKTAQVCHVINTTASTLGLENSMEFSTSNQNWTLKGSIEEPTVSESNDPLVYTIFTSGSTGEPKGVMISTEAVQSFTRWMIGSDFSFSSEEVFINTAILSFDLSVFELMTFGALGATLLLNSKTVCSDPNLLCQRIEKFQGTVWVSTPSFAFPYTRLGTEIRMDSIRTFLFCGEILPHATAKSLLHNFSKAKVLNTYGPTEATVATTLVEITKDILDDHPVLPVGKCRPEAELFIENSEIIITGPHVAKGYMANPELNALKFTQKNRLRAFKTGDKGFLEEDMLFFEGRNDDLVKLHGYRIELNEITSSLLDLPYIFQAETIALKRSGIVKKIVGLVAVRAHETDVNKEQIKHDLSTILPHYMVPSDIKILESIPLNMNGKADKKQLESIYLKRT